MFLDGINDSTLLADYMAYNNYMPPYYNCYDNNLNMLNNFVGLATNNNDQDNNPYFSNNSHSFLGINASDEDYSIDSKKLNGNRFNPQISNNQCEKKRNLFSSLQVKILEASFQKDNFINSSQRTVIAQQTGLTSNQVNFFYV